MTWELWLFFLAMWEASPWGDGRFGAEKALEGSLF